MGPRRPPQPGEAPDQAPARGLRLVRAWVLAAPSAASERPLGKTLGDIHGGALRHAGREAGRIAWCYVYAEGSGATSHDSDKAQDTRGSRNAAASER